MARTLLVLVAVLAVNAFARAGEPQVVFEDSLKGKLGKGWTWLRENPGAWRATSEGLEIRVEPGMADTVKNALVRKAPDRSQGKYAIEVTVEFTSPPTEQYEQAGLTWYEGKKPKFKLVHERVDGKPYIIPGKKLAESPRVQLRLVLTRDQYITQFRPGTSGEFETTLTGNLPAAKDEQISIQCYHGPANATHWMRLSDFKILKLPN